MALESVADEYFSTLNPIASRIHTDLQETKGNYEDLWDSLSKEEKEQILTESIIKPEVLIKYGSQKTTSNTEYALKIVVDDHCSYRDEHSGPFSLRTRSQRNLTVFQNKEPKNKPSEALSKVKPKPVPKPQNVPHFAQDLDLDDILCITKIEDGLSSNSSTLPKTGLDFLDNW